MEGPWGQQGAQPCRGQLVASGQRVTRARPISRAEHADRVRPDAGVDSTGDAMAAASGRTASYDGPAVLGQALRRAACCPRAQRCRDRGTATGDGRDHGGGAATRVRGRAFSDLVEALREHCERGIVV